MFILQISVTRFILFSLFLSICYPFLGGGWSVTISCFTSIIPLLPLPVLYFLTFSFLFLFLDLIHKWLLVKGSLTRDFRLQVFFHKSVSLGPLSIPLGPFKFFSKILGDIREWMFISGVNDTGEKREKFLDKIFYKYFVQSFVECTLHLKIEVLLIFHFQV